VGTGVGVGGTVVGTGVGVSVGTVVVGDISAGRTALLPEAYVVAVKRNTMPTQKNSKRTQRSITLL
jgi:hypothetical protein